MHDSAGLSPPLDCLHLQTRLFVVELGGHGLIIAVQNAMAVNRPPRDITPETFFSDWLLSEYKQLREAAGGAATPPNTTIGVNLDGDGGGEWTLTLADGELSSASGLSGDADVTLVQSVNDWRALMCGEEGAPDLVPANANPMDALLAADQATHDLLTDVVGCINLKMSGFGGRDWQLQVMFKNATEPEATFAVDAETYGQMLDGSLPAPQAYFAGKIAITGDTSFAMQLAMAAMARMNAGT